MARYTKEDIIRIIEEEKVNFICLQFTDILGMLKSVIITTSQLNKAKLPTHIELIGKNVGRTKDSVVLLEQVRTLDKRRLREKMGRLDESIMSEIDTAIAVSLGLLPHAARAPRRTRLL